MFILISKFKDKLFNLIFFEFRRLNILTKIFVYFQRCQRFILSANFFKNFIKNCDLNSQAFEIDFENDSVVGVLVLPWVFTAVPWYSIALGIGLSQRGKNIVFIWDDCCFPSASISLLFQNLCIRYVIKHIDSYYPVVKLSELKSNEKAICDDPYLHKLAELNLLWQTKGGSLNVKNDNRIFMIKHKLSQIAPLIESCYTKLKLEYILIPGGIYSSSGLFIREAVKRNVRVSTYDGGMGYILCSTNGIAAHQSDIPEAFYTLWNSSSEIKTHVIIQAKQEMQSRIEARDKNKFQITPLNIIDNKIMCDILIPLNIEWDAAALGNHHIFDSTADWLLKTISFLLENSNKHIVIRQHPGERLSYGKSYFDLEVFLTSNFIKSDRISLIRASDPVSTYQLLASAHIVLPFTSSVGIEAAALGKAVIICGTAYYKDLGFVHYPISQKEYFKAIHMALDNVYPVLDSQVDRALVCYYLTQICNLVSHEFNSELNDFFNWCKKDPQKLFSDPTVADLLYAIDVKIPLSWLRHCINLV